MEDDLVKIENNLQCDKFWNLGRKRKPKQNRGFELDIANRIIAG